jgi:GTP-binding protein HflX
MEQNQKAILVGVNINNQQDFEYSMRELFNLADACDIEVVGEITQNLNGVNKSHYIGTGKIGEVLELLREKGAETAIFNDELSPSQIRTLEEVLDCSVIDRTVLILEIFSRRAKTKEAQLQVEIAELQYMLPRLVGLRKSLGRQVGGVGTKVRGSGEKKLELDRRKITEKISVLRKELEIMVSQRRNQRKQRSKNEIPTVSLVGYTNAGKSTIMNAMIESFNDEDNNKLVFEKDMLFATLETSVRRIDLPKNKSFLLTDTVGFVSNLPHHLIKAFRSTLEEVAESDLLIHVVDYSNPEYMRQIEVTKETLKDIGVEGIPIVYAYNKADLTNLEIPKVSAQGVYLSAKQKKGINELIDIIKGKVFKNHIRCEMLIPYEKGHILSYLNERAHILNNTYEENGTRILVECEMSDYKRYQSYVILN